MADENIDDLLIISKLFADEEKVVFYDRVHIMEHGNYAVAQAILPRIIQALPES